MLLVMATPSPLRDTIAAALERDGQTAKTIAPDVDDPFEAAMDCRAVVYLPAPSMIDGGTSSLDHMRAALTAAHAPGVEVLVAVVPLDGYDDELDLLASDGVPYVVLRAPMLLEELGRTLDDGRWLLVSKDESVRAVAAEAVVAAIRAAIATEEQGRSDELGRAPLAAADALERAAEAAGRRVRVIALWPPLARAVRWLSQLFRRREPAALAACARYALPPARAQRQAT